MCMFLMLSYTFITHPVTRSPCIRHALGFLSFSLQTQRSLLTFAHSCPLTLEAHNELDESVDGKSDEGMIPQIKLN